MYYITHEIHYLDSKQITSLEYTSTKDSQVVFKNGKFSLVIIFTKNTRLLCLPLLMNDTFRLKQTVKIKMLEHIAKVITPKPFRPSTTRI